MKIIQRAIIAAAIVAAIAAPQRGEAQDVSVHFLPGMRENSSSWGVTPDTLQALLHIFSTADGLCNTTYVYNYQAGCVSASSSSILIGHSNGGIVARIVGSHQPLAGIMTFASPNRGAAFVDGALDLADYGDYTAASVANAIADFAYYASYGPEDDTGVMAVFEAGMYDLAADMEVETANWIYDVVGGSVPVLAEMSPSSAFMADTLAYLSDSAAVNVGVIYETDDYFTGGFFQLADPSGWVTDTEALYDLVDTISYYAEYIEDLPDGGDPDVAYEHDDESDQLYTVAYWFDGFDDAYCGAIHEGSCYANDEVVAGIDQYWPGAIEVDQSGSSVHTLEASNEYIGIGNVLTAHFSVTAR